MEGLRRHCRAGDRGWTPAELQIEASVPGILILTEVLELSGVSLPGDGFEQGAIFVAGAYSVGLVSAYVTRMMLDRMSERGLRGCLSGHFAHLELDTAVEECAKNDPKFTSDLEAERKRGNDETTAKWNALERSALRRTTRREEVHRRRSQGRLLRNLLLPVPGALLVFFSHAWCWTSVYGKIAQVSLLATVCSATFFFGLVL